MIFVSLVYICFNNQFIPLICSFVFNFVDFRVEKTESNSTYHRISRSFYHILLRFASWENNKGLSWAWNFFEIIGNFLVWKYLLQKIFNSYFFSWQYFLPNINSSNVWKELYQRDKISSTLTKNRILTCNFNLDSYQSTTQNLLIQIKIKCLFWHFLSFAKLSAR